MSALQDLCEHALLANGIASRPKAEWDQLMESAKAHVRSMPLEFENSWPRLRDSFRGPRIAGARASPYL
jgi:hypothetical protein